MWLLFNPYPAMPILASEIRKTARRIMCEWFGKGCTFQCNQWEENELTGGPKYKETRPTLTFCNHKRNPEYTEGNCRIEICPIKN